MWENQWKAMFIRKESTHWNLTVTGFDKFMNECQFAILENDISKNGIGWFLKTDCISSKNYEWLRFRGSNITTTRMKMKTNTNL